MIDGRNYSDLQWNLPITDTLGEVLFCSWSLTWRFKLYCFVYQKIIRYMEVSTLGVSIERGSTVYLVVMRVNRLIGTQNMLLVKHIAFIEKVQL